MPKRTDLESILIIGSGPIVIGQACEFDYSGTQAVRVLRQEGYRVVLLNSNPATIMTDPEFADATFVEPITVDVVESIIKRERPDALLPTLGGQTALNVTREAAARGVFEKYGVELIGAGLEAIETAEDRGKFKEAMEAIGIATARSVYVRTVAEAIAAAGDLGYPLMIRPSYILGGGGHWYRRRQVCTAPDCDGRVGSFPRNRGAGRSIGGRLEGVRARGDEGRARQRRRRVLDREPGPYGHSYGGFDHGGPRYDALGPRVPGDARRGHCLYARHRR